MELGHRTCGFCSLLCDLGPDALLPVPQFPLPTFLSMCTGSSAGQGLFLPL